MNLFAFLFAVFIIVPLVEIFFLIQVGQVIGALPTIALVLLTAAAGVVLIRFQGIATLWRARAALMEGRPPAIELLEGALLIIAGLLLLTPGFVTDFLGFLCLIPPLRRQLILLGLRRFLGRSVSVRRPDAPQRSKVIEGEYRREDDGPL